MRVPIPAWEPDKGQIDATVATTVRNVLPAAGCYLPAPNLNPLPSTTALAGRPKGGPFLAQASDGTFTVFAAANNGSTDRIYTYNADGTWTDRSFSGGYSGADLESGWKFAQFGNYVWAVSGANNAVQRIDLANLVAGFAAVSGNGGTDPPRARFITVINEFVVLCGLTDFPTSVAWCGFGDSLEWRLGVSGADRQEFPDGGLTSGLTGSEYGLVFQENSIRRMVFNPGDPLVFSFSRLSERIGTSAVNSIISNNGRTYALLEDGWYMEAGGSIQPIGKERVDRTFLADLASGGLPYVLSYVDPVTQRAYFPYPSSSQSDLTVRNKCLVFDPNVNLWTLLEVDMTGIGPVATAGIGLDTEPLASSNIDTLTYSLDSTYWQGGRPVTGGFDSANKLATFTGSNLEATIETGVLQAAPPNRAMMRRVSPLIDTASAQINVATRESPAGSDTWRTATTPSSNGYCHFTASGRFHRLRLSVPAGTSWTKMQGMEAEAAPLGGY